MSNLKRGIFLKEIDKYKRTTYLFILSLLLFFFVFSYFIPNIKANKIEIYKLTTMSEKMEKNETYKNITTGKYNTDDIVSKIQQSQSNLLNSFDPNNYAYIQNYVSKVLVSNGQSEFRFGEKQPFSNKGVLNLQLPLVFTNKSSMVKLLQEFRNDGYLGRTEISKNGDLYQSNIELVFTIN